MCWWAQYQEVRGTYDTRPFDPPPGDTWRRGSVGGSTTDIVLQFWSLPGACSSSAGSRSPAVSDGEISVFRIFKARGTQIDSLRPGSMSSQGDGIRTGSVSGPGRVESVPGPTYVTCLRARAFATVFPWKNNYSKVHGIRCTSAGPLSRHLLVQLKNAWTIMRKNASLSLHLFLCVPPAQTRAPAPVSQVPWQLYFLFPQS